MAAERRVGVWLVGGRGSVALTAQTGAAAVAAGLAEPTGLITMRAPFTEAGLPGLGELVFGGHDVVETPLALRAARLVDDGVLPVGLPRRSAARWRRPRPSSGPGSRRARRAWSPSPRWPGSSPT
jgi:myo-inositol-1-phosphate synthase